MRSVLTMQLLSAPLFAVLGALTFTFTFTFTGTAAHAQEASTSLHSTVSGNQEQPRVMYIVPWQQPAAADFDYELQNSIAEDLFTPVDRDEFVRELAYRNMLNDRVDGAEQEAADAGNQAHN